MVSAMELRKRLIDGAIPVEARKKPKSIATIAGPGLIDFPRISTTRTTANNTTTDSEMATIAHTLMVGSCPKHFSGPGVRLRRHTPAAPIVPPTRCVQQPGDSHSSRRTAPWTPSGSCAPRATPDRARRVVGPRTGVRTQRNSSNTHGIRLDRSGRTAPRKARPSCPSPLSPVPHAVITPSVHRMHLADTRCL